MATKGIEESTSFYVKAMYILLFVFIFFLFLAIIDEATDFLVNIDLVSTLFELIYMLGSGFLLIINMLTALFRDNGINIWISDLFTYIIKVLAWFGFVISTIIHDIFLGISNLIGELIVKPLNNNSPVVCLGSCNPIPDKDNLRIKKTLYYDIWVFIDFKKALFEIGARWGTHNEVWQFGELLYVQDDFLYFLGGFDFAKFGFYAQGFLMVDFQKLEFYLVDMIRKYSTEINSLLPSWTDIFDDFFIFNKG